MMVLPTPRSHQQIVADLLQVAIDSQWSAETNIECGCHPRYVPCCPECDVLEYHPHANTMARNEHKPDCKRMKLISETRAYLEVENKLMGERGDFEGQVCVP